jgi:hypothetical protein
MLHPLQNQTRTTQSLLSSQDLRLSIKTKALTKIHLDTQAMELVSLPRLPRSWVLEETNRKARE